MDVDLRQVRAFVVVAEELHFGRAAARLYISQPHLSQQIRRLEEVLGVQLLERTSRSVALTQAGKLFLEEATSALEHADRAVAVARRFASGESGTLQLGCSPTGRWQVLPELTREFRQRFPGVRLITYEGKHPELMPDVLTGRLDAALVICAEPHEDLLEDEVASIPIVLALPSGHPLAGEDRVPLTALRSETILTFPRALAPRYSHEVTVACRSAGFEPALRDELAFDENLELVREGHGVALVAAGSPGTYVQPGIDMRPIEPELGFPMVLVRRKNNESALLRNFLELARRVASPVTPV